MSSQTSIAPEGRTDGPGASLWATDGTDIEFERSEAAEGAGETSTTAHASDGTARVDDPRWVRPALVALLLTTFALYLWQLGDSGWANAYYTAAVQAGTHSWKAMFFGSIDSSNYITIDKTPAALWPMVISARVFGVNSWSILVPQAIEGVVAVGVLFATLRRWFGGVPALLGAAVMASTPAAALMFRYNNPDALLVCLLVVAAYWMTRAIEDGRTRSLVYAGLAVGFAFLAKELQAFLVVPGFCAAYLVAGPPKIGRRIAQLIAHGIGILLGAGWWVAIVSVWPATSRPYIGGSQNNSFWNVLFGYNGFGRLTGNESGSVGGQPAGGNGGPSWGPTGWTRMFNNAFGGQASWLLPAALFFIAATVIATLRSTRTNRTRAAIILWGGWLLVTGIAFSLGQGIIHEYYTVALAPAIGAAVAIGAATWWRRRDQWMARVIVVTAVALSAWWSVVLLNRSPQWHPWMRAALVATAVAASVLFLWRRAGRAAAIAAVAFTGVGLLAPVASSVTTATAAHNGPLPTAGPASQVSQSGRFGRFAGGPPGGFTSPGGALPGGNAPNFPGGAFPGGNPPNFPGGAFPGGGVPGSPAGGAAGSAFPGGGAGTGGGPFATSEPPAAVVELLQANADEYRWVAAGVGATSTAGYQLASDEPLMAIGGFNGTDPSPTLAQFQDYVAAGDIHYFIGGSGPFGGGGGFGGGASNGTTSEISTWVNTNFTTTTVDGVTLYDLTQPNTATTPA